MSRFQKRKPQSWEKYNSILFGVIVGLVVPFIGLAILMMINEQLVAMTSFDGLSEKLLRLLAICLNLIPFNIFSKKRLLPSMRGVFLPTMLYIIIWLFLYSEELMKNF